MSERGELSVGQYNEFMDGRQENQARPFSAVWGLISPRLENHGLSSEKDEAFGAKLGLKREEFNKCKNGLDLFDEEPFRVLLGLVELSDSEEAWHLYHKLSEQKSGRPVRAMVGKCFVCGDVTEGLDWILSPTDRFCNKCSVGREWPESDRGKLVTVLPDWDSPLSSQLGRLPALMGGGVDMFATLVGSGPTDMGKGNSNGQLATQFVGSLFPYPDFLKAKGFRCGSPLLFRAEALESFIPGLPETYVLDFQYCQWTNTLKDLRSWHIVNFAVKHGVTTLALWTAGNAGVSLGKISSAANRFLQSDDHLSVFVLYSCDDRDAQDLEPTLKLWNAKALGLPTEDVYEPERTKRIVEAQGKLYGKYWETTDGWEALGCAAYRLLMAQVISQLKPSAVVVPAGTGNLLIGTFLACEDVKEDVTLYASVPANDSIFDKIDSLRSTNAREARRPSKSNGHTMPKLAGAYSPLLPCVDAVMSCARSSQRTTVKAVRIDDRAHKVAASSIAALQIKSEPSAWAPFSALMTPEVRNDFDRTKRVLVLNSGCGLLSTREYQFLSELRS